MLIALLILLCDTGFHYIIRDFTTAKNDDAINTVCVDQVMCCLQ